MNAILRGAGDLHRRQGRAGLVAGAKLHSATRLEYGHISIFSPFRGNSVSGIFMKGSKPFTTTNQKVMNRILIIAASLANLALGVPLLSAQNLNTAPLFNVASGAGTTEVCTFGDYAYQDS